jgi:transposase InsO family protein
MKLCNNVYPRSILKKKSQYGYADVILSWEQDVQVNREYNIRKHIQFPDHYNIYINNIQTEDYFKQVQISTNTIIDNEPVYVLDLPQRRSQRIQEIKDTQEEMRDLVRELDNRNFRNFQRKRRQPKTPNTFPISKAARARRSKLFIDGANKDKEGKENYEKIREETMGDKFLSVDALVGQFYLHPDSNALMEIVGTRKGLKNQMFTVAQERNDDEIDLIIEEDLLHRFKFEETVPLVIKYSGQESLVDGSVRWPQNFQEWKIVQENDVFCKIIMDKLKEQSNGILPLHPRSTKENSNTDFLFQPIINGVYGPLMRQFIHQKEIVREKEIVHLNRRFEQKVVPKSLINHCIEIHHEKMGHPGRSRTENTIKLGYYWGTINQDVAKYIKNCHFCQCRKANNRMASVPIQEYDPVVYPFQRTHVDLSGPFNETKLGNKYILVFKDALTKWVEIFALSDKTAIETLTCLDEEIVNRHGSPELLITDRGTEFSNKLWKDYMKLQGIKHVRTTPANPRSDGLAENMMRTLKDMLSGYINKYHDNWDEHLAQIAGQYRSTVNDATGYTPFYLLYGREMNQKEILNTNKVNNLHEYAAELQEMLFYTWSSVSLREKSNVKTMQLTQIPRKKIPFVPFTVGSYCYLKTVPRRFFKDPSDKKNYKLSSKLQFRYSGPYRIVQVISPVIYKADIHGTIKTVHAINMKHKSM